MERVTEEPLAAQGRAGTAVRWRPAERAGASRGILDAAEGEECDFGSANGAPGVARSTACKISFQL